MLHTIYFSPSGTTKATAQFLSNALDRPVAAHDITVKEEVIDLGSYDDVVLFAAPVYAGRIPPLAAERFSKIMGHGQKAIAVVVYGNRDYDDALLELCDIVTQLGFKVMAAGAFIGEHCIFPEVATHRPDGEDKLKINEFARKVNEAIFSNAGLDRNKVKGKRPYKKIDKVPLHPKVDKNVCNSCGACVNECPTGAISKDYPQLTDSKKCITCCRCIQVCPLDARKLAGLLYKLAGWKFVKDNTRRLEPEWFV